MNHGDEKQERNEEYRKVQKRAMGKLTEQRRMDHVGVSMAANNVTDMSFPERPFLSVRS